MKKSKLITLLSTFSRKEMDQFGDFLASPYFNKKQELIRLFHLLQPAYPTFDIDKINKPQLYAQLFPDTPYQDKSMRYLMSDLTQAATQFLGIQQYEKNEIQGKLDLLSCFLERDLEKHFLQLSQQVEKELKREPSEGINAPYLQMQFADLREHHFGRLRQRRYDKNIQIASDQLDRFYFLKKLKYSVGMQDRQQFLSAQYEDNLTEGLLQFIEENNFFDSLLIKAYYPILLSIKTTENDQYFNALKDILKTAQSHIPLSELKEIYLYAINFCARKIRAGRNQYLTEALELYQRGINQKILIDQGQLSPWTFTNVVKLALRLQYYDWIENFIQKYSPLLPPDFRQNAMHYNLAELYYYRKDYNQAQIYVTRVQYTDLNYYLGARVLLIKIYKEQGEEEVLLSQLASFLIFLKRNKKISVHLKATYQNFCNLLFAILKATSQKLPDLQKQIHTTSPLTDKGWLLEQVT